MILKNVVTKFLYILLIGGWIFLSIFFFLGLNLIAKTKNYNIPAESNNQPIVSDKNGNNLVYISYDIFKNKYSFDPITSNISGNNINSASLILKNQYQRTFSIIPHNSNILNVIDSKIYYNQIKIMKLIFALLRSLEKMQLYFILHETKDDVLNNLLIDFMNVKTEYDSMNYTFCFFIFKYIPKKICPMPKENLLHQFLEYFSFVITIILENFSLKDEVQNEKKNLKECVKYLEDFKCLFKLYFNNKFGKLLFSTFLETSQDIYMYKKKLIFVQYEISFYNRSIQDHHNYISPKNIVKYPFYIFFNLKKDIVLFLHNFIFTDQVKRKIKFYNHYYKIIGFVNLKSEQEKIRLNLFDGNNLQIYEDDIWRNITIPEILNDIEEYDASKLIVLLEIIKN